MSDEFIFKENKIKKLNKEIDKLTFLVEILSFLFSEKIRLKREVILHKTCSNSRKTFKAKILG